ncbi:hypothetical protein ACOTVK_03440 [Aliarcobacter butzleri]
MSEFIKSKKFTGVYYRKNKKGDITYYFTFKDEGKTKYQKVGNKSQGINEKYVNDIRNTTMICQQFIGHKLCRKYLNNHNDVVANV